MGRAVTELSTHTFELDLTSVCVSSGTIQLPLKMLPYFTPGRIPAVVDGQAVELEFEAPRRLMGLRQLFAERGLRSNDRVRFELELDGDRVVGLRATCIRRERPKAPEAPAPKEAGKASHVKPVSEPWESGGGVRVVKRIRIPGLAGAPAPAELVAHETPSEEGEALTSGAQPSREPTRSSWDAVQEQEVFGDGITTVRAVRRSRPQGEPERVEASEATTPAPAGAGTMAADQVVRPIAASYEAVEPRPATSRLPTPVQLSDLIAPPLDDEDVASEAGSRRPRRWALAPRLRFGAQQRQPHTSGPSRARSGDQPLGVREPSPTEAREAVPVELHEVAPHRPAPGLFGAERGAQPAEGRAGELRAEQAVAPPRDERGRGEARELVGALARPSAPGPRASAQRDWAGDASINPFRVARGLAYGADQAPERSGPSFAAETTVRSAAPASAPRAEHEPQAAAELPAEPVQPLRQTLLIDDEDFGGEYLAPPPQPPFADRPAPGSLEADIAQVKEYLSSPGTPAIVRAEAVGLVLGIGEERAERALERISEEPDSVSRIRRGAYMVRRRRD